MNKNLDFLHEGLKDKKVLITLGMGEIGWFLQRLQGHLRFLKINEYKDYEFVVVTHFGWHPFVSDFCAYTVNLPDWFYEANLDADCYEAVPVDSPAGSLTPPEIYQNLILFMKEIGKTAEICEILLPPRGCNFVMDNRPQVFKNFKVPTPITSELPIMVVFPRKRVRAANRNVPEFVWEKLVQELSKTFLVALAGTPAGACLEDMQGENIVNLIKLGGIERTEKVIEFLSNAVCSISSQSGGTHISLLTTCPSYVIGHEKQRHVVKENRLEVPTSFRFVSDYRAIDAETIIKDIKEFLDALVNSNWYSTINRPSLLNIADKKGLVGVEVGVSRGYNALNMLENLDIEKLYLIDPYVLYRGLLGIGCGVRAEQLIEIEKGAHKLLEPYKDKIVWIKDLSEKAVEQLPDELDFIYVDGNHRYEYALRDLELYYPKLKEGGLITCHDYDYGDVAKAFNEFFKGFDAKAQYCYDNRERLEAWVIKPSSVDNILTQDYNKLLELVQQET